MRKFTVYSVASGEILRTGFAAAGDVELQAGPGEAVYPDVTDDMSQRIDLGTLQPVTDPDLVARVAKRQQEDSRNAANEVSELKAIERGNIPADQAVRILARKLLGGG